MNTEPADTPLLILLGPTASGKTRLATRVARQLGGEIISADSRQVYRQMDIGTGKDLDEYFVGGQAVPYHLIDICEPGTQYNVNDFQRDFDEAYRSIVTKEHIPVVCGGTGFYIYALLKGHANDTVPVNEPLRATLEALSTESLRERFLQTESSYHALADISTRKRLIRALEIVGFLAANPDTEISFGSGCDRYKAIIFGLDPAVEVRRARISKRLDERLKQGLINEVQNLLNQGLNPESLIYYGLEYKYVTLYLTGVLTYEEMRTKLETEIHRFAKRQMTFFRKMEKDGLVINWLPDNWNDEEKVRHIIQRFREYKNDRPGNV
jgi:tRNA dimethylallyltransferase